MKNKVVIVGMPGSGKTTIGKTLAEELSLKFFDMDEYIQDSTGKTISQLFESGEDYFRDIETKACRELMKYENVLISTGGGVIKRQENVDILKEECLIIFLDRPVDRILSDVDVSKRPLLKDGKEKVIKLYEERYALYKKCADEIVLNDSDIDKIIAKFKDIISNSKQVKI